MAKKRRINEYDQNPALKIKNKYKKKRRVRRLRLLFLILVISAVGYYIVSPYSKIQSIEIAGAKMVDESEIKEALPYHEGDFRELIFKSKIKSTLQQIPGIKGVEVTKNLDTIKITITENNAIAYQEANKTAKIVFDDGSIKETNNADIIKVLHSLVRLSNFNDDAILQQFASSFSEVEESVRSQISDVYFEPSDSDPLKIKMISDDGKECTLRIDEMTYQLKYYNNIVSNNNENCYFDFLGSNVYQRACSKKEENQ